ncbi:hypothetical protein [Pseudonocardia abyssalis]|uniref:SPW repeat-containing protein n=1 Tax=Pseudonocardia abyssalis TaxID=2792008 RepID=A0ABS6UNG3_9PSEU|nr:hypothetical protein [Pseudonocardia abyssalis]MBW0118818.1 hypothetical protein [Pseudonocardia abyssalis]MBW0133795.1 hypothetical protein [Pseudonocardia abyssalis]
MRFTWKDAVAAVLVAAIVVPYVGYLVRGEMPFVQDPRGMAATGIAFGLVAALLAGRAAFDPGALIRTALGTGVPALGLGVAAAWTGYGYLLAAFVIAIVVTWALGTLIHTRALPPARTAGHVRQHV